MPFISFVRVFNLFFWVAVKSWTGADIEYLYSTMWSTLISYTVSLAIIISGMPVMAANNDSRRGEGPQQLDHNQNHYLSEARYEELLEGVVEFDLTKAIENAIVEARRRGIQEDEISLLQCIRERLSLRDITVSVSPVVSPVYMSVNATMDCLFPADPPPLSELQKATAERAFIMELVNRLEVLHIYNERKVNLLVTCFDPLTTDLERRQRNCEEETSRIRNSISLIYPRARSLLALFNVFKWSNMQHILLVHDSQVRNQKGFRVFSRPETLYISYPGGVLGSAMSFDNPLVSSLGLNDLKHPDFKGAELNQALEEGVGIMGGFSNHFTSVCKEYTPDLLYLCSQIDLHYSEEEQGFYLSNIEVNDNWRNNLNQLRELYVRAPMYFTKKEKELKTAYFELIQKYPYVALVSSAGPTDRELYEAFKVIHDRAKKSLSVFQKKAQKIKQGEGSRGQELSLLAFSPVIEDVLESPSREMRNLMPFGASYKEHVLPSLMSEYANRELKKMGLMIGGVVAASIATCAIPLTRFVKGSIWLVDKINNLFKSFKSPNFACIAVTSGVINIGFLFYSYNEYQSFYREVFSALDEKHMLREVEDLTSAQMMVIIDAFLLPIGTGAVLGPLRALGRRLGLMDDTTEHLVKAAHRHRLNLRIKKE